MCDLQRLTTPIAATARFQEYELRGLFFCHVFSTLRVFFDCEFVPVSLEPLPCFDVQDLILVWNSRASLARARRFARVRFSASR